MDIPRHWRLKKQRYSLTGEVCEHCDAKLFPPRDICPECGEEAKTLFQFSGKGEVYSFTTVYDAPEGYAEQAPYTLAMVKLVEGPLVTAQLTDLGEQQPAIGMPVEMVTRLLRSATDERGMLIYGYKFRPAVAQAG
ncbi:MAG: Zn-ribbon domain-containing OB-fold protein [Anaerolineales bacterium]|nr:MAG: Zn-ribbon domain-containing OB-fold protein [Anaerolineales bacterium]